MRFSSQKSGVPSDSPFELDFLKIFSRPFVLDTLEKQNKLK